MRSALIVSLLLTACAPTNTQYLPQVVAKDELALTYEGRRFVMYAQGDEVARGLSWKGLTRHVRCVPRARQHAEQAERSGSKAVAFSIIGGVLGGVSLTAFAAFASPRAEVWAGVLSAGVVVAAIGTIFAGLGYHEKNVANGSAIDAMNYFNDAAGSWGGSCDAGWPMQPATQPATQPASEPASRETAP